MTTETPAKEKYLNQRQELFASHLFSGKTITNAAQLAGYSPRTAYSIGSRLLKNVEIQKRIAQLQEAVNSSKQMPERERREVLANIAREVHFGRTTAGDRIRAVDTLNKLDKLYGDNTLPANINIVFVVGKGYREVPPQLTEGENGNSD